MLDALGNITSVFALRQARAITDLLQRRLEAIFVPLRRSIVLNEAKWCAVDVCSKALSCSSGRVVCLAEPCVSPAASIGQKTIMLGSLYMVWEYASQAGGVISAFASNFQNFARQHADFASADPIRDAQIKDRWTRRVRSCRKPRRPTPSATSSATWCSAIRAVDQERPTLNWCVAVAAAGPPLCVDRWQRLGQGHAAACVGRLV